MKILTFLLIVSSLVEAKSTLTNFSEKINEEVKAEIQQDDEAYKKRTPVSRGPASIQAEMVMPEEPEKLEKNHKQLGPRTW